MKYKGKMIGKKDVYDKEMVDNVDRVECVIKKLNVMKDHATSLLKNRDAKLAQAAKVIVAYGAQTVTQGSNAYLRSVGPFLEKIAAKHKSSDQALFEAFVVKLQSWLGTNQKNVEMQIKHMEELRKEMQKTEKKAASNQQMGGLAEASKGTWTKYCEETTEVIKKFLANAEEFKKHTIAWIEKEKEIEAYNREQCQGAAGGNKSRKEGVMPAVSAETANDDREDTEKEEKHNDE